MHVSNTNGTARRKPMRRAQVKQNTVTNQVRELIEGHARRILYHSGYSEDVSEQVADILGVSHHVAEMVTNQMFHRVLLERDRLHNGLLNTLSHAKAARSDLQEAA